MIFLGEGVTQFIDCGLWNVNCERTESVKTEK